MTDKKLHDDLRAWLEADAPGQDRVRELRAPDLPKRPQRKRTRRQRWTGNPFSVPRFALQGAVACALFALGYFIGTSSAPAPVPSETTGSFEQAKPPVPKEDPRPRPPQTFTREEDGRLVIETTLKESGARALWVVDGRFDLAKSEG